MTKNVIIFSILFCFACCTRSFKDDQIPVYSFKDFNNLSEIKLSELGIKNIHYIPLEKDSDALIDRIWKIKIFDEIYISTFNSLLKYSSDGKLLGYIGKEGRGPGEFIFIKDFSVDVISQMIFVLTKDKINIHSLKGDFIKSIKCSQYVSNINCTEGNILCYNMNIDGTVGYTFDLIDYEGTVIKKIPNKFKFRALVNPVIFESECCFSNYDRELYLKEIFSDTVLYFRDYKFSPYCVFDFGEKKFTPEVKSNINKGYKRYGCSI